MRSTDCDSRTISVMRLSTGAVGEVEAADALCFAGDARDRARQQQRREQRAEGGQSDRDRRGDGGALHEQARIGGKLDERHGGGDQEAPSERRRHTVHQQPVVPAGHHGVASHALAAGRLRDLAAHGGANLVLAGQAFGVLDAAGLRLHEDDAGFAGDHDDGVGRDLVVADQAGERVQREVEADHAALAQRHAGRHPDDIGLGEAVGFGQHRRLGPERVDVPGPLARVEVERARPGGAAAAVGHLEPPGLAPRRAFALDRAQDHGRPVRCVEFEALVDREGLGPADIDEVAVRVADIGRGHGGRAAEQRHELTQALGIGRVAGLGCEARGLGERRADRHDDAQAARQEAFDGGLERGHALADAALLEMIDGAPSQPQQRSGQRQDDQRHQRQKRDAEGNGASRAVHCCGTSTLSWPSTCSRDFCR